MQRLVGDGGGGGGGLGASTRRRRRKTYQWLRLGCCQPAGRPLVPHPPYTSLHRLTLPPQVGVFSATLPPEALEITRKFMNKPVGAWSPASGGVLCSCLWVHGWGGGRRFAMVHEQACEAVE